MNLSSDPALERLLPEGLSIQEAVVDADRSLRWAITSFGGMCEIRGVPPGHYVLEVRHEACEPLGVDVEVHRRAAELRRDFGLRLKLC